MNPLSRSPTVRLTALVLIAAALAGCKHKQRWEVVYFEIEAVPIEVPIADYKLKHPVDIEDFTFSAKRVERETVGEPNAAPLPQRLALVRSLGPTANPGDDCTGFFVSKRDFLTARHCVPKSPAPPEIDVDLGKQVGTKRAKCSRFPSPETWKDWAICTLGEDIDLGDTFALTRCAPRPATKVVITGFCELIEQQGAGPRPVSAASAANSGVLEILERQGGFLPARPELGQGTSACPLDSGGPAFIPERLTRLGNHYTPSGSVRVFGIISGIGKCPEGEAKRTCIAPTTDESFVSFLREKTGLMIRECSE